MIGVMRPRIDLGGEIENLTDGVFREQLVAELFEIEPLIRPTLEQAIKQVEPVDIYACVQDISGPERATAGFRPPCAR